MFTKRTLGIGARQTLTILARWGLLFGLQEEIPGSLCTHHCTYCCDWAGGPYQWYLCGICTLVKVLQISK